MTRKGISGKAENPDLESRLLRLENTTANLSGPSDPVTPGIVGDVNPVGVPPQVTGIKIANSIVNTISISWSPLDPSTIDKYEIWVYKTERPFEDIDKFFVSENTTSFIYTKSDPSSTSSFTLIVRGVAGSGRAGPWSSSVDSVTGKVTRSKISKGAFTTVDTTDEVDLRYDPVLIYASSKAEENVSITFGELIVDIKEPGTVLVFSSCDTFGGNIPQHARFQIDFLVNDLELAGNTFQSTDATILNQGLPFSYRTLISDTLFYAPTPDIYTFKLRFTLAWTPWFPTAPILYENQPVQVRKYKLSVVRLVRSGLQ